MDSVDRGVLHVSRMSAIRRFTTLNSPLRVDSSHTKRWTRNALNPGVLDLPLDKTVHDSLVLDELACKTLVNLKLDQHSKIPMLPEDTWTRNVLIFDFSHLPPDPTTSYSLVLDELARKTLINLKLHGGSKIPMLPEDTCYLALKSLTLYMASFCSLGAFEKLIYACPLLEELSIDEIDWELWKCSHILSCPILMRLSIETSSWHNPSVELGSMSFDIPSLVYMDYSDFVQRQYPIVKLDSLVEAKLDLLVKYGDRDSYDPSNLFKGLKHVEKLSLSFPANVENFNYYHEAVHVFENVSHLSITTNFGFRSSLSTLPSLPSEEISKCTHSRHQGSLVRP